MKIKELFEKETGTTVGTINESMFINGYGDKIELLKTPRTFTTDVSENTYTIRSIYIPEESFEYIIYVVLEGRIKEEDRMRMAEGDDDGLLDEIDAWLSRKFMSAGRSPIVTNYSEDMKDDNTFAFEIDADVFKDFERDYDFVDLNKDYIARTQEEFEKYFRVEHMPAVVQAYELDGIPDLPGRREEWNNVVDMYIRDDMLPPSAGNWEHPRDFY